MDTVETLQQMRGLMAEGWTRETYYRVGEEGRDVKRGRYLQARREGEKHECCAGGALLTVTNSRDPLWRLVWSCLRDAFGGDRIAPSVHWMNDQLNSQEEALSWIDRAIAIARQQQEAKQCT